MLQSRHVPFIFVKTLLVHYCLLSITTENKSTSTAMWKKELNTTSYSDMLD